MAEIFSTVLATSQPLTICEGFYLFPSGSGPFNPTDTMKGVNINDTILNFNADPTIFSIGIIGVDIPINITFSVQVFIGFCGPAYALSVTATGQTYDATDPNVGGIAVVQFDNGSAQGGFGLGAVVGFTFGISIGLDVSYGIDVGFFKIGGSFSLFTISFSFTLTFDILQGILQAVAAAADKSSNSAQGAIASLVNQISPTPANFFPSGLQGSVFGFYDQTTGPFAFDGGTLTLMPSLNFLIDIVPFVEPLKAFQETLEDLGGTFVTGPTITFTFPITINVANLLADSDQYSNPSVLSGQASSGGTVTDANPGDYQQALAVAAITAYQANNWVIPQLPDLLAIAGRTVQLGIFPDTKSYLISLIQGAGGTVPTIPTGDTGYEGNAIGFTGGPNTAASRITNVTAQFTHTTGLTVSVGWGASISIFGLSASVNIALGIDATSLFGSIGPFGTVYTDQITNVNGGQYVFPPLGVHEDPAQVAIEEARKAFERPFVDVVFEKVIS